MVSVQFRKSDLHRLPLWFRTVCPIRIMSALLVPFTLLGDGWFSGKQEVKNSAVLELKLSLRFGNLRGGGIPPKEESWILHLQQASHRPLLRAGSRDFPLWSLPSAVPSARHTKEIWRKVLPQHCGVPSRAWGVALTASQCVVASSCPFLQVCGIRWRPQSLTQQTLGWLFHSYNHLRIFLLGLSS